MLLCKCTMWHQICEGKCSGNHHFKMHLKANAKEIVTWNACDTKYVQKCYFDANAKGMSHAYDTKYVQNLKANAQETLLRTPNMYKILWRQIKNIITWKFGTISCAKLWIWRQMLEILTCIWHHICTKLLLWRQMPRKLSLHLTPKCTKSLLWRQMLNHYLIICGTKLLLWRQMPRKLSL